MVQENQQLLQKRIDRLFVQYGKPLLKKHAGKYVAISPNGETIIAKTRDEVMDQALKAFGPGSAIFQLGKKAVYTWRSQKLV